MTARELMAALVEFIECCGPDAFVTISVDTVDAERKVLEIYKPRFDGATLTILAETDLVSTLRTAGIP